MMFQVPSLEPSLTKSTRLAGEIFPAAISCLQLFPQPPGRLRQHLLLVIAGDDNI